MNKKHEEVIDAIREVLRAWFYPSGRRGTDWELLLDQINDRIAPALCQEEPLAVLAARKGYYYLDQNTDPRTKEVMIILKYSKFLEVDQRVFFKKSFRATEKAARAALDTLPDVRAHG